MSHILVVDDDPAIQNALRKILQNAGYDVLVAEDGNECLRLLKTELVDVVFLDFRLPGIGGFEVLEVIKSQWQDIEVVMISGHANVENAVKAIKLGAYDYLEKPLQTARVLTIARNAVRMEALRRENTSLRQGQFIDEMIGSTQEMRQIQDIISQSAPSDSRVMILGENGTGKELVARMIHAKSHRYRENFVVMNCAAIPDNLIESELFGHEKGAFTGAVARHKGKFEIADGGTLFLDEVADMSLDAQAKVLRAIQEMTFTPVGGENPIQVDVRVISATNKDILGEVKAGTVREDLFFRLNVIPITLPPLRDRKEDIPALIAYYQQRLALERKENVQKHFTNEAMELLIEYPWPGNIRELKNFVERITILVESTEVSEDVMKYYLGEADRHNPVVLLDHDYQNMKLAEAREKFEMSLIQQRLAAYNNKVSETAQALGVYTSNLHKKIKKYGIEIVK